LFESHFNTTEKNWNIRVPGFSSPDTVKPSARRPAVDGHSRRLQAVRKAVAAAPPPALGRKRKASDPDSNIEEFPQQ
jgi:transcription initiation factor TFIID subunit TAF12